jgi:hypothetical protein
VTSPPLQGSPDEKIFIIMHEKGIFPSAICLFQVRGQEAFMIDVKF